MEKSSFAGTMASELKKFYHVSFTYARTGGRGTGGGGGGSEKKIDKSKQYNGITIAQCIVQLFRQLSLNKMGPICVTQSTDWAIDS
jgi:hypothetical protein